MPNVTIERYLPWFTQCWCCASAMKSTDKYLKAENNTLQPRTAEARSNMLCPTFVRLVSTKERCQR